MRVLILIESGPDGRVDVALAHDRDWRSDPSQALPAQRLALRLMDAIREETEPAVVSELP